MAQYPGGLRSRDIPGKRAGARILLHGDPGLSSPSSITRRPRQFSTASSTASSRFRQSQSFSKGTAPVDTSESRLDSKNIPSNDWRPANTGNGETWSTETKAGGVSQATYCGDDRADEFVLTTKIQTWSQKTSVYYSSFFWYNIWGFNYALSTLPEQPSNRECEMQL
jgi:hypothetical protein